MLCVFPLDKEFPLRFSTLVFPLAPWCACVSTQSKQPHQVAMGPRCPRGPLTDCMRPREPGPSWPLLAQPEVNASFSSFGPHFLSGGAPRESVSPPPPPSTLLQHSFGVWLCAEGFIMLTHLALTAPREEGVLYHPNSMGEMATSQKRGKQHAQVHAYVK